VKRSAGILLTRKRGRTLEFFLVHPGGPFWARKDLGAWSIPKGELDADEDPEAAARREFREETSLDLGPIPLTPLGEVVQKSGKRVIAFAGEADVDPAAVVSNTVVVDWPPRSGRKREVPEVDRAGWFDADTARQKINPAQAPLIDRALEKKKG
jgi:predicted NUDIX family NTP pyrophosphohydrolase